ncbi:MAG: hypothetical protein ACOYL3_26890 [Desulfuromonadaceae bacterium]
MQVIIQEREAALAVLEQHIYGISKIFRESYLKFGRGALIVYTDIPLTGRLPSSKDYNGKQQSLDLFDSMNSKRELAEMIDGYAPNSEGVMVLISTSDTLATWFVTVKLKSRGRQ